MLKILYKQRLLFIMSVPFVVHALIFSYIPIWGWIIAFFDYKAGTNILTSKFVGFKFFIEMFSSSSFFLALRNTIIISVLNLTLGTLVSITFAILLNEIKGQLFKRTVQTISYLPHFVSWVVVAGIFGRMLAIDGGTINDMLIKLNLIQEPIAFQMKGEWFWWIVAYANIWKETGWNAIIYIAVLVTINPELYEAAYADGANRFRRIWHISLPGIKNIVVIMLVLQTGWMLGVGFEQSLLMGNNAVIRYSDVLSTYVMRYGIQMGRFSFATAAGIFQSMVGLTLVMFSNGLAKRFSNTQIF